MPKYEQEVKDKAVELAKKGVALTAIQSELGPNPKATMRYLAKAGIDYKVLREELKAAGKLQAKTNKQGDKSKEKVAKQETKSPKVTKKVE